MRLQLILFFVLTALITQLWCNNLRAQTLISGTVADNKGAALPGANIYLEGTYDGVSSDQDGFFRFNSLAIGNQVIKINFIGYDGFSQVIILDGKPILLNVVLNESFNLMNAVTITAGAFEAGDEKKTVVMNSIDMVTTAGAMGDIYGALQTLPGTVTNGESGKLFVKGGSSDESQTYIDGTLVMVPYNSSPPNLATRGRFNPFMFKGTIFSTGGYSAEYGQALSSVLQLSTNDVPVEDELNISLLSVGCGLAGTKRWNTGAITTSVSYSNLRPYMMITPQNVSWNHPPEELETALSFRQETGKSGLLKMYVAYSSSTLSLNKNDLNQENEAIAYNLNNNNLFLNTSWRTSLGTKWTYRTGISLTNNEDITKYNQVNYTETIKGIHLKNIFSHQVNEKLIIKMGSDLFIKEYVSDYKEKTEMAYNILNNNNISVFSEAELYITSKFIARIGGRVEYSDYMKKTTFSPRFSAAYKTSDYSQFSLAYGWFYQDPANNYLLWASQLDPERADHYILSFQSSKNERTFRSEIYYKDYRDLTKYADGAFYLPETYSNTGHGYATGLDVFWRDNKTIKRGEYWISYSYLDTKRDFKNYPYEVIPTFASKHNLSFVYKHWFSSLRSLVGASYKFSSPRYYTDPNQPGFNNQKTIPYHTLDLNWSFLYRENIIFYAGVSNVLGFKQEFGYSYAQIPDQDGIYQSQAIVPGADRFFVIACFITLSNRGDKNQLDKIN